MLSVAIGWQMYELTQDAFSLGMVGLAQFIPMLLLTLFVGQIADRYDRRRIVYLSLVIEALTAVFLLIGSISGWLGREEILLAAALIGACRAFEGPTANALLPQIVSRHVLPRAVSMSTTAIQTALILGPSIGGLLLGFGASHGLFCGCCRFNAFCAIYLYSKSEAGKESKGSHRFIALILFWVGICEE